MCCQDYGPNDVATLGVPDHGHFEDVGHRPVLGLGSSLRPRMALGMSLTVATSVLRRTRGIGGLLRVLWCCKSIALRSAYRQWMAAPRIGEGSVHLSWARSTPEGTIESRREPVSLRD